MINHAVQFNPKIWDNDLPAYRAGADRLQAGGSKAV